MSVNKYILVSMSICQMQASHVPGLVEYLATLKLPKLDVLSEGDGSMMVAIREYGHDATEVAHSFTNTDRHQTQELGVYALDPAGQVT